MQIRTLNNVTRVLTAGTLVALVGGQALAAKSNGIGGTQQTPIGRPKISIPKPNDPHGGEYDKPDLWARGVVTSFDNFDEPDFKLVLHAEVMNVGSQDFQGSRVVWLVATHNGNPVVLAKKTLTSLKKGKSYFFAVDQPAWFNNNTDLSLSIDPSDYNPGNDYWDESMVEDVEAPG